MAAAIREASNVFLGAYSAADSRVCIERADPCLLYLPDALPYIDQELDSIPGIRRDVEKLVREEMKTFKPKDYLADFPTAPALGFEAAPLRANRHVVVMISDVHRVHSCLRATSRG